MDACQRLRYVLSGGADGGGWTRSVGGGGSRDAGEWRGAAAGEYARFYFYAGSNDSLYCAGDDAFSWGFDCDWDAGGSGAPRCGRCGGGQRGGSGDAEEFSGG